MTTLLHPTAEIRARLAAFDRSETKDFDEAQHPRDLAGRFADLPGGKSFLNAAGRRPEHGAATMYLDAEQRAYISRLDLDDAADAERHEQMLEGVRASQAKANIAAALADRLNNPEDWEKYRRYHAALRSGPGARDRVDVAWNAPGTWEETTAEQRKASLAEESSKRVGMWASTAGDSNPWSVMMQRAVESEFDTGGDWDPRLGEDDDEEAADIVDRRWDQVREFYRRFARVMYENTQDELAKAGITEVTVRRGMVAGGGGYDWEQVGEHPVTLQPANSWSTSTKESTRFALNADVGSDGRILTATFPASRVLGSARSGFGSLQEEEYVILNGPENVTVDDRETFLDRRAEAATAEWVKREAARRAAAVAAQAEMRQRLGLRPGEGGRS